MPGSMRRKAGAVAVTVTALLIAGCGSVHPGSAAIVDGDKISIQAVDDEAQAYCDYALVVAEQSGGQKAATSEARRQALTGLITERIAERVAADAGITVAPKEYELTPEEEAEIDKTFAGPGLAGVREIIERSKKTSVIITALGERELGVTASAANSEQVDAAGNKIVQDAIAKSDLTIDSRFGLDKSATEAATTGSLSVAEISQDEADSTAVASGLRCS